MLQITYNKIEYDNDDDFNDDLLKKIYIYDNNNS